MELNRLLYSAGIPHALPARRIDGVTDELSSVDGHTVFVCVRGERYDGHALAAAAAAKGAPAVICERPLPLKNAVPVANSRAAFSRLAYVLCEPPGGYPATVGVTGTNGKTTTAAYLSAIYSAAGEKCAVIGTLGVRIGDVTLPTAYTTPKSIDFFRALAAAAGAGCTRCAAEISSLALAQDRVAAARFVCGAVTNIGEDHLEAHGGRDALIEAKTRLCALSDRMLLNLDDPFVGRFTAANAGGDTAYYSCRRRTDLYASSAVNRGGGTEFTLCAAGRKARLFLPHPGVFSVYNALAACGAALLTGVGFADVCRTVPLLPQVPGRMQRIDVRGVRFYIDYAHTPEALRAVLEALKEERPLVVFGCGGERDRAKRPVMGGIAARYARRVILTSDNPRGEDPLSIIREIRAGIPPGTPVEEEPDRGRAVALAFACSSPGDTVLLAGKGHETAQEIGGEKRPFSDEQTVSALAFQTPDDTET